MNALWAQTCHRSTAEAAVSPRTDAYVIQFMRTSTARNVLCYLGFCGSSQAASCGRCRLVMVGILLVWPLRPLGYRLRELRAQAMLELVGSRTGARIR